MNRKILITGASGFIGRNLTAELRHFPEEYTLLCADVDTPASEFDRYLKECDAVVHLAGINRPKDESEFQQGNADLTRVILMCLEQYGNCVPIVLSSSIQAELDNAYGQSKLAAERAVQAYGQKAGAATYVFRLPNVFGKWCRPNYNSAVATFCHNIAHGLPIEIRDRDHRMTLVYIDDVVALIRQAIAGEIKPRDDGFCAVPVTYSATLGEIADLLTAFHDSRGTLVLPPVGGGLGRALYATYLSYLEPDRFSYRLTAHSDARGGFTEFFKTGGNGQFSVSTTAPGVTRGNHWHHTKTEKFLVVAGEAAIRLRQIESAEVLEYRVAGTIPEVVDIPPGYTHSIVNISRSETLVTVIWASELFDPAAPDTYSMEV